MPRVPRITGEDAIRAFSKMGFRPDHTRGSHHILRHPDKQPRLSIPVHAGKTVGLGLLKSQIELAGMTIQQFVDLL
jgi:predicted RNA binding protein YcfA (HicA-like mRNA interferase family)